MKRRTINRKKRINDGAVEDVSRTEMGKNRQLTKQQLIHLFIILKRKRACVYVCVAWAPTCIYVYTCV